MRYYATRTGDEPESIFSFAHIEQMLWNDETSVLVQYSSGLRIKESFKDKHTATNFMRAFLVYLDDDAK